MRWFSMKRAASLLACYLIVPVLIFLAVMGAGWLTRTIQRNSDINDFAITNFAASYTLERVGGSSTRLTVEELIEAEFTHQDLNHGIIRSLPGSYRGQRTIPRVKGVTLADGSPVDSSVAWVNSEKPSSGLTVRIGDPDAFVNGKVGYRLTYNYSDPVQAFGDVDEFYWNINGAAWRQRVERASVRLTVVPELAKRLTGSTACYGADDGHCPISMTRGPDGAATLEAATTGLDAGQSLTIAVGFVKGTVSASPDVAGKIARVVVVGVPSLALLGALGAMGFAATRGRRWMRGRTRLAQFLERDDLPPAVAAEMYGVPSRGIVGELLKAAVAGQIRLFSGVGGKDLHAQVNERLVVPNPMSQAAVNLALGHRLGRVDVTENVAGKRAGKAYATARRSFLRSKAAPVTAQPWSSIGFVCVAAVGAIMLFAVAAGVGIGWRYRIAGLLL